MNDKVAVIIGSARKNSDTRKLVATLFNSKQYHIVDLLDYNIAHYTYEHNYPDTDDFLTLTTTLLRYNVLVFATPVYWYAMSGYMKVFFDRLTDLVTYKKEIGRKFSGKNTFLISVSSEHLPPTAFDIPFKLSSGYLDMVFVSSFHCATDVLKNNPAAVKQSASQLIAEIEKCIP